MKKFILLAALLCLANPALAAITLTIAPGTGTTSYIIQKSVDSGPFANLISLTAPNYTYVDTDTPANHEFSYRVISYQGTVASVPGPVCSTALTVNPSTVSCVHTP